MMLLSKILIFLVKQYQFWLRPWIGWHCRFTPRCSDYSIKCLELHGAVKGSYLTINRLCRCHPFAKGGIDNPPCI